MTIKLGNLSDWRVLEGKSLNFTAPDFDGEKPRKVRLDLNSEYACNWYIRAGNEERFLAVVPAGLQTLEFIFGGNFEVMPVRPDDCEIQYWTSEAEEFWTEGDGVTFSTIYERQPRNEAVEYVMRQAMFNQLRRDQAHASELESMRAEIGAMKDEIKSGIHGEPPAEHKEPAGAGKGGKRQPAKGAGPTGSNQPADRSATSATAKDGDASDASSEGENAE